MKYQVQFFQRVYIVLKILKNCMSIKKDMLKTFIGYEHFQYILREGISVLQIIEIENSFLLNVINTEILHQKIPSLLLDNGRRNFKQILR